MSSASTSLAAASRAARRSRSAWTDAANPDAELMRHSLPERNRHRLGRVAGAPCCYTSPIVEYDVVIREGTTLRIGARQRITAATAALLLVLTTSFGRLAVSAATPNAAAAAQHLARTEGGAPDDYHLVYERRVSIPGSDATLWAGKLLGPGGSV